MRVLSEEGLLSQSQKMRTFQQSARMPPSNGIPESRKREVKHKIKDVFDQIKSSRATVTVKAQLSQGLQVYRFFTQSCFKFLYPERSSTVRSERRTTTTSTQWSWDPVPVHISQGLLGCTGWSNRDPPVIPWKLHPFPVQRCSPDSCCHS